MSETMTAVSFDEALRRYEPVIGLETHRSEERRVGKEC